jgi:hypothetical protein
MSGVNYKEILKKGWHPEKEGTTFKGQMVREEALYSTTSVSLMLTVSLSEKLSWSWRQRRTIPAIFNVASFTAKPLTDPS